MELSAGADQREGKANCRAGDRGDRRRRGITRSVRRDVPSKIVSLAATPLSSAGHTGKLRLRTLANEPSDFRPGLRFRYAVHRGVSAKRAVVVRLTGARASTVTQAMPAALSNPSGAAAAVEAASGYFGSEAHYLSVAGRILTALRGDRSLVLVAGEPTAEPQPLSQALRKLTGSARKVIGIPCGPELTGEEVSRADSVLAKLPAGGGTVTISDTAETDAPLFVFDEAERLSDQQLGEVCATIRRGAGQKAAGVLLASPEFLVRLEEAPLQFLREELALRLRFDEIGDDEGIDFLRHQLAVRHSQDETRRSQPIFFRSLAVLGVLAAIGVAVSLALYYGLEIETPDGRSGPPASDAPPSLAPPPQLAPRAAPAVSTPAPSRPEQMPQPNASAAAPAAPTPQAPAPPVQFPPVQFPPARSPPVQSPPVQSPPAQFPPAQSRPAQPPAAQPPAAQPPAGQRLSSAEIATLVARGDRFLSAGDIASARLFYERAADAGDSAAALRLGATFDPGFLSRAGIRGKPGDPAQAASWYRRARDLGDAAAAERLKDLERQPR
jgi:hypothetical protein